MASVLVVTGDIAACEADIIVNAANETLLGGGGVDGAIHDASGPGLLAECRTLGGCPPGEVRVTGAHDLPYKAIIHAVGPIWRGGDHEEVSVLRSCYEEALETAFRIGTRSIAFPAISTGAFGFPERLAARIAARICVSWKKDPQRIFLVAFDWESEAVLSEAVAEARRDV